MARPRKMEGNGAAHVETKRRREAQTWKVGDACTIRWPGIKSTLRCRVVAIRWWMPGTCVEVECPVIEFPTPQRVNGKMRTRLGVTADCLDPIRSDP